MWRVETVCPLKHDQWTVDSGVTRICCEEGQSWKLGHGAVTADFRAGCSSGLMTNSFVNNAVLMQMKEL